MDSELDPFIDEFDEPAAPRAKPAVKFQPKARPRKGKATSSAAAAPPVFAPPPPPLSPADITVSADVFLETDAVHDLVTQPTGDSIRSANEEVLVPASIQESVVFSAFGGETEAKDPVASETVDGHVDSDRLQSEDLRERTDVVSEPVVESVGTEENPQNDNVFLDDVESLVPPESSFVAPSEARHESEGTMPAAEEEYVYDLSSLGFDDFVPSATAASELPMNSEQTGDEQTCVLNEAGKNSREDAPEVEKENRDNNEKTLEKSKTSSLGSDGSVGKLSMQLRKQSGGLALNESDSVSVHDDSSFLFEAPECLGTNGDDDYEYRIEDSEDDGNVDAGGASTSKKKKAAKRSKKSASGEEKPGRKRKKASDTSEQSEQKQLKKKFSHSTRRKKRYRNDELLKVPEDEIEFRSLTMRDIIFLAEHKERLAAKDAKASLQTPSSDKNTEEANDEEDNSESEEPVDVYETPLFNSHSFMNRTPTMRWSKQDTDLFYEGIRQFGSDLSMVQQLFPERTRRQIKNKFKTEERRHPFLLSDALQNPNSDTTYFEKVYNKLAQAAADEGREPLDLTGEKEADLNLETNEEPGKNSEQDEQVTGQDPGDNPDEAHSNEKIEEEEEVEDEDDLFSSYKCEF